VNNTSALDASLFLYGVIPWEGGGGDPHIDTPVRQCNTNARCSACHGACARLESLYPSLSSTSPSAQHELSPTVSCPGSESEAAAASRPLSPSVPSSGLSNRGCDQNTGYQAIRLCIKRRPKESRRNIIIYIPCARKYIFIKFLINVYPVNAKTSSIKMFNSPEVQ